MKKLKVELDNCYGIQHFRYEFDLESSPSCPKAKAYAIYAPNGIMKTSFAKTFQDISANKQPQEERYNRNSLCIIEADNSPISSDMIYVLKSDIDITTENSAVTNILVDPENKKKYDAILVELDKLKNNLVASLQKLSKVKKTAIEQTVLVDWDMNDFSNCIAKIMEHSIEDDLAPYTYATIFDPIAFEVLQSQEFISKANEFNNRYQELFTSEGSIYTKGIFNPIKAEASFTTLEKQGYFGGGHRVHLRGDETSIGKDELNERHQRILGKIDSDEDLKKLRASLAKNVKTQDLIDLIEELTFTQVEFLLENLKPEKQAHFRQNLWVYYFQSCPNAKVYLDAYYLNREELNRIEAEAAKIAPLWKQAVELFNNRFVDMPFTLSIANQKEAALGIEKANLKFNFQDGNDTVEWSRSELKTLSQGEKRALYLLNFIFEVEYRKLECKETLFVLDDIADSFDYKNKHAIIQYLKDLTKLDFFYHILLTHNFDFFRTLSNVYVHRDRCLMTVKNILNDITSVDLKKAEGVKNYFIGVLKRKIQSSDVALCATIPFTRNLIEYTKGEEDPDFKKLTSLLHWKSDTDSITVKEYLDIYNELFGTTHHANKQQTLKKLLFQEADKICCSTTHDGLNLEDKVLLCMAIRMKAECFMINKIRILKQNPEYWCESNSQFGVLLNEYETLAPLAPELSVLEKVSITVSSNIHLNSFMYEPILDLGIEHLISLYNEVTSI